MARNELPFERLLQPITASGKSAAALAAFSPDGAGRDYAYDYGEIEEARRVVEETTRRDDDFDAKREIWKRDSKTADWSKVLRLGVEVLCRESKDLQVAAWVIEALGQSRGFTGLRDGFHLMRRLQGRYWLSGYPRLEEGYEYLRQAPYEFLNADQGLPLLIRSIPLTDAAGGMCYPFLRFLEAKDSDRLVGAVADESEQADLRERSRKRGRIFTDQWEAAVSLTPLPFFERLSDEIRSCLIVFKAWEKRTDRLFGAKAPSLGRIERALLDCAGFVAGTLEKTGAPPVELNAAIRRVNGARRERAVTFIWSDDDIQDSSEDERAAGEELSGKAEAKASDRPGMHGSSLERVSPPATAPASIEDAFGRVRLAAGFLREQDPSSPISYLLTRALRLGELHGLGGSPSAEDLPAPGRDVRQMLERLASEENWGELLDAAERAIAAPEGRAWLDAHRYAILALEETGREASARACRGALAALLLDFPELPLQDLDDGTPAARAETRAWLQAQVAPIVGKRAQGAVGERDDGKAEQDDGDLAGRAAALARSGRPHEAIRLLSRAADSAPTDRSRFLRALETAELCVDSGLERLAVPLLEDLAKRIDDDRLEVWEGREFCARVAGRRVDSIRRSTSLGRELTAANYLLKLDGGGIKGESPVDGFKDYIEILSYHRGARQTGTFAYGQGGGGGKVKMKDFEFVMKTNQASPKLIEACANGTAIKTATLVCRKAGGKTAVEFLKIEMTDCLISSYRTGLPLVSSVDRSLTGRSSVGDGQFQHHDDLPVCQIALNFAKIVFTYKDQKADGTAGSAVEGGWDQKKQKSGK